MKLGVTASQSRGLYDYLSLLYNVIPCILIALMSNVILNEYRNFSCYSCGDSNPPPADDESAALPLSMLYVISPVISERKLTVGSRAITTQSCHNDKFHCLSSLNYAQYCTTITTWKPPPLPPPPPPPLYLHYIIAPSCVYNLFKIPMVDCYRFSGITTGYHSTSRGDNYRQSFVFHFHWVTVYLVECIVADIAAGGLFSKLMKIRLFLSLRCRP